MTGVPRQHVSHTCVCCDIHSLFDYENFELKQWIVQTSHFSSLVRLKLSVQKIIEHGGLIVTDFVLK